MNQLCIDFDGAARRDAGIAAAVEHAEAEAPGWSARALCYVREFCGKHAEFTGEDVRLFAEGSGLDNPPHKRAWGGVMLTASRARLVQKIGTRHVRNPKAHRALATLWRRVVV